MGRNSVVSIATRNGLDNTGIKSRWWTRISAPASLTLGPAQPHIPLVPDLFHRNKAAGTWR